MSLNGYRRVRQEEGKVDEELGSAKESPWGSSRPQQPLGLRRAAFSFVVLILLITVLFLYSSKGFNGLHDDVSAADAAISLNPEAHLLREPKTLRYDWNVTLGHRRPDGVLKPVYLVNNQFPGPTIEAKPGDTVEVAVLNSLEDEGLAIHWHGLHMHNANDMDGAVGITQRPIAPGHSFTYRFTIAEHQHGTFWYHAHDHVQRGDGLYGGFIVHHSDQPSNHSQERLLMIGDWYHQSAQQTLDRYLAPGTFGNEPVPDSLIINSKGSYNCSNASPARPVDCQGVKYLPSLQLMEDEEYLLRIVNTGTLAGFSVAIPGANLIVYSVDGGDRTRPTSAEKFGVLYPGQRVDVLVQVDKATFVEIELDDENSRDLNPALTSLQRFPVNGHLVSDHVVRDELRTFDLLEATALTQHRSMPEASDETMVIYTNTLKLSHRANLPYGYINHTSWIAQDTPLVEASEWDENQLVPFIQRGNWMDLIINNIDDGGHPFHMHGVSFYVLQTSQRTSIMGSYNPFEDASPPGGALNLVDPLMRDTVFVPARGYVVLRFHATNNGLWFAHCHLLSHQASGMAMTFEIGERSAG